MSWRERAELEFRLRRELKLRQDRQACEESLYRFVHEMWHVLEPQTKLVDGWAMEAICEHLEAVTYGEITRLLINVPPGSSKSLLCNCFWPAWEWARQPHLRYLSFSYAAHLTERDNRRFRDIIQSQRYQEMFSDRFTLVKKGEEYVSTNKTGFKVATSVGGVGTGERGDRVLCFPASEMVRTEAGPVPIGDIVKGRLSLRVWSLGPSGLELKPIEDWKHNPGSPILRLTMEDGSVLRCTPDHKILTPLGYVEAGMLSTGFELASALSGVFGSPSTVVGAKLKAEVYPCLPSTNARDCIGRYAIRLSQLLRRFFVSGSNLAHHLFGKVRYAIAECTMPFAVSDVLRPRSVFEIVQGRIGTVSVLMPNLLPDWTRSQESPRHHLVTEPIECLSSQPNCDARISSVEDRSKKSARNEQIAAFSSYRARHASDAPEATDFVKPVETDHMQPDFIRIRSIERFGHEEETFCLTVADNHNMLCGEGERVIICANCDDPHNVKEAESDTIRAGTVEWFSTAMSNRLNDMERSAIVVIMQRVHEDDVSGFILDKELPYEHLMIPAEYESERRCTTSIGWEDPRIEESESFWPERFPQRVLDDQKRLMGPFAFSGQYMQRPDPKGGGIIKRDWWQLWEDEQFPAFDYILASLDTAYTEKQENDYSALTVWGIFTHDPKAKATRFMDEEGRPIYIRSHETSAPKVMLMNAWQERLPFHELVAKAAATCRRFKVDTLLVENKAAGISVAQELKRLFGHEPWAVQLSDPKSQDKVARLYSVQHIWAEGLVCAPDRTYADQVITQMAQFPKGKHDDLVDTCSQAIRKLRDMGLLSRSAERQAEMEDAKRHYGGAPIPLYPA